MINSIFFPKSEYGLKTIFHKKGLTIASRNQIQWKSNNSICIWKSLLLQDWN